MLKTVAGRGMRKFKAQTEDNKPHLQIKPPLSPVPLSFGSCYSKQRFNIPRLGIASAGLWTRWEGDNSPTNLLIYGSAHEDLQNLMPGH